MAAKTRESILLCEAAGFDVIVVETVGTGQSEITLRSLVDFFLLLLITGAGDELQGIKKGVIEIADALVINKADGDNKTAAGGGLRPIQPRPAFFGAGHHWLDYARPYRVRHDRRWR